MFRAPRVPTVVSVAVSETARLLDVREPEEWQAGHVEGSQHVPLGELPARAGEVPHGEQVVVVCRSGARSAQATAYLAARGVDAVNLDGGLQAWAAAGRPLVRDDGGPPHVA
jgi:rhodanese-related sulfurtransferase